ncbi:MULTISPECIES: MaoC family dehydratase [Dermacoccus]|jgi:acyl dehydratase|uniref:MaoC family dehydratase n=1 Tax=Dermacoccus abyssi TaxID=322596 RepID=A0ABX5Z781_9MICO|nr:MULTISPECIES: MaoC family dehydratase [Dermacoccus]KLO63495.1 dehydratase [Dermacoccus sp. PE3]MBE7370231.1 MaoC family dehydratase [Dermacoccus barathri]MBZ4496909.1 MaoC family dehydratase [Dermacoccus sp. Tok2021]MCT1987989.1 MaoC family dehydratase [Dermacoccus abyssi]QEH92618.1 MaoC family dehydratase [Dermacoccus abyssi]
MRTFNGLEELKAAVGEELGSSEWHEVTQTMVDQFAEATGDHQWIHVDPEKAKAGPFGTTIAHGYLTLSLVPMLAAEIWSIENISMAVNYGSNKVRFTQPVPVGSRVRGTAVLDEVKESPKGAQVAMTFTVEIEGEERPACVAQTLSVIVP